MAAAHEKLGKEPTYYDVKAIVDKIRGGGSFEGTEKVKEIIIESLPVMSFYERADLEQKAIQIRNRYTVPNENDPSQERKLTDAEALNAAVLLKYSESGDWLGGECPTLSDKDMAAVRQITGSQTVFKPGDFDSEKSLTETQWVRDSAGNVRKVTPEEAGRVAIIIKSGSGDWLSGECPTLGGKRASIIQDVVGNPSMSGAGLGMYKADISHYLNYFQVNEDQAKQAINLLVGDSTIGNEWVQRNPETGEWMVDPLEVGIQTGVGYPTCPIMSNDIEPYLNYVIGAGPRPEAPTSEDIERIKSGQLTETTVNNKVNEIEKILGIENKPELKEKVYGALALTVYDKSVKNGSDSSYKKLIEDVDANDIINYNKIIDKVDSGYELGASNATSVLIRHIAKQRTGDQGTGRTANPNYKLSDISHDNIIKNIEADKSDSGVYNIIKTIQKMKTESVSLAAVDFNRDGSVNACDMAILLSRWNDSYRSSNIDSGGSAGPADFAVMMSHWNYAFK